MLEHFEAGEDGVAVDRIWRSPIDEVFALEGDLRSEIHLAEISFRDLERCGGEVEITDLNKEYLKKGKLKVRLLGRGYAWLDTGTSDSLIDAAMFIKTIEQRQGLKIGCIEEVAYRMGYITRAQLDKLSRRIDTGYGEYLKRVVNEK